MAILTNPNQSIYSGKGYLDAKIQPVATVSDLNKIPRSQRFIGLTVTVLDDGSSRPYDYWIENNVAKWVKKTMPIDGNISLPLEGNDKESV